MKFKQINLLRWGWAIGVGLIWLSNAGWEAAAQQTLPLTERSDFVNGCRLTGSAPLPLFEDARLTRTIGSVAPTTRVTLTGVVGSGTAQIKAPLIGWVQAGSLKLCQDGGSVGTPTPERPVRGACRRLRDPDFDGPQYAELRNGLVAYEEPGRKPQRAGSQQDGPGKGATVYFAEPRQVEGKWVRVFYTGIAGNERLGWVSLGTSDRANFAECLPPGTRSPSSPTPPRF
jgi:hypothetical protein